MVSVIGLQAQLSLETSGDSVLACAEWNRSLPLGELAYLVG